MVVRTLCLVLGLQLGASLAFAQNPDRPAPVDAGDAVVTGFSGTTILEPKRSGGADKSAIDLTFIDPDGPVARVLGLTRPGFVADGRLFVAPKTYDVFARDVGQVFGVALDDQTPPHIYLSATSAFGLNLVARGRDGSPERRKVGGPGVGWMKGQFGADLQGDPGSIYRIDAVTGAVSVFAKVMLDGVPNPGPALGNLAYDSSHKQLFASDLYTGMIHRFSVLDGAELGAPYDHGVTGRLVFNLAPTPFNPGMRPNIASGKFDSGNPATWGFAAPERQVWALAVQDGRLFYSARNGSNAEGPQILSVALLPDGAPAGDVRAEVDVPAQPGPYPVTDIAFSQTGAMLLAQRAPLVASYDYSAFVAPGQPRVLRYRPKDANDPPSPGLWKPAPEEYPVGFAGDARNSGGGVALGFGYDPTGALNLSNCEGSLLFTGDKLRLNNALRDRLAPGGPLAVDGLQVGPFDAVKRPDAELPWTSYFVDFDDKFVEPTGTGRVGGVRTFLAPCAAQTAASPGLIGTNSPPGAVGDPQYVNGPQTGGGGGGGVEPPPQPPPPPASQYDLTIKKTAGAVEFDPKTATWTITYTIVVINNGDPFAPASSIAINDPIPAGMTLSATAGAGWTCGGAVSCNFAFGPGLFATGGSLPALTVVVTTKTPGTYANCADVAAAGLSETTYANNKDCATVTLKYPPNRIEIEKVNLDPSCTVELLCRFQIKVKNLDPWPFTGPVTITDNTTLAMNVAFTDIPCSPAPTTISFACTTSALTIPASGSLTFTVNGVIPAGSVPITGVNPDPVNCATLSQPPAGTTIVIPKDCKPYKVPCGFACHMTDPQIDQIKIVKTANSAQCSPGGLCSYTFTVSNVSTTNATAVMPITFIDTMPAGATNYVGMTPPPWGCVPFGAGQIKCLHPPGTIPAGGQIAVTVTFQIAPSYNQPTLTNCSEFFVGQTGVAQLQRRPEALDADALQAYLQNRGLAAMPQKTVGTLHPDDKSCTTVNIAAAAATKAPPPPPPPLACKPPLTLNAAGECACPPRTVLRGMECVKQPATCQPPFVMNATGACACPQGAVMRGGTCVSPPVCRPPLIQGPTGACVCPPGTVPNGGRCLTPIVCRNPMVPNPAGRCVCPAGLAPRGGACVTPPPPVVCAPPARLNSQGACQCPTNMVAVGRSCVPREQPHEPPRVTPGDIMRIPPGLFPRGGRDPGDGGPVGPRGGKPPGDGGPIAPRGGAQKEMPGGEGKF